MLEEWIFKGRILEVEVIFKSIERFWVNFFWGRGEFGNMFVSNVEIGREDNCSGEYIVYIVLGRCFF